MSGIDTHGCMLSEETLVQIESQHDLFSAGSSTEFSEDESSIGAILMETSVSTSKIVNADQTDPTVPIDDLQALTQDVPLITSFQRELAFAIERMLDPDVRGEVILMNRSETDGLQFKVIYPDDTNFDVLNLPEELEMIVIDAYHPLTGEAYKKSFHMISQTFHTFFE